jgi:K+-transporting ATPase ATPase C chain
MKAHLRANLWLLGLTLVLCAVLYPASLWLIGQAAFSPQANGSLIVDAGGKPIASRLIAHEVKDDRYFQPRPSAVAYNAAASGASNFGANNYLLRDRVARSLGPVVKYGKGPRHGEPVAPDVVKWFREKWPGLVEEWATAHPKLAEAWVKSEDATRDFVRDWFAQRPAEFDAWRDRHAGKDRPEPEELAVAFFTNFARHHPATWLSVVDSKDEKGKPAKQIVLIKKDDPDSGDIAAVFFDLWRDAHPDVALENVPGDLVTTSASGLDPHITLAGALYQLPRVADRWAELTGKSPAQLRRDIDALLREHARAPLFGMAGVPLVNVVAVNVELHDRYTNQIAQPK